LDKKKKKTTTKRTKVDGTNKNTEKEREQKTHKGKKQTTSGLVKDRNPAEPDSGQLKGKKGTYYSKETRRKTKEHANQQRQLWEEKKDTRKQHPIRARQRRNGKQDKSH